MPRYTRLAALALVLPGLCSCTLFTSRPAGVKLRFAWPENLTGRVFFTQTVLADGDTTILELHRTFRVHLEPGKKQGQQRLVPSQSEDSPPEFADSLDPEPVVLFDREGGFVGIEAPEELSLLEFGQKPPETPEEEAEARKRAEQRLEHDAWDKWNRQIARWRGVVMVPKEIIRFKTTAWVGSQFDRRQVDAEERNTLETGVSCTQGGAHGNCVRIRVELAPLKPLHEGQPIKPIVIFELVTEPDTLLPHFARMERTEEAAIGTVGEETTHEITQVDEYVFTYGSEPAPKELDTPDASVPPRKAPIKL